MILFRALHKRYVNTWNDYEKGTSFKEGARWNLANTPVLYMSSNVQNAMLELTNYLSSPKLANKIFVIGVFESPALRLKEVQPEDLPANWECYPFSHQTQHYGSEILNHKDYDGLVAPSCTINTALAISHHNEVRRSIYHNVVLNPEKNDVKKMVLKDTYSPVYSNRMFT